MSNQLPASKASCSTNLSSSGFPIQSRRQEARNGCAINKIAAALEENRGFQTRVGDRSLHFANVRFLNVERRFPTASPCHRQKITQCSLMREICGWCILCQQPTASATIQNFLCLYKIANSKSFFTKPYMSTLEISPYCSKHSIQIR